MKKQILSIDFSIVITVISLMAIGLLVQTSAEIDTKKLIIQFACALFGTTLMLLLAFWNYDSLNNNKNYIYLLSIFLLLAVLLLGTGREQTGANSWIRFGAIGVQPSEFVKLLFALYISFELSDKITKNTLTIPKELILFLAKCSLVLLLVVMQNDTGTALVFLFMLAVALFVAGIPIKYILLASGALVLLAPVVWLCLSGYQKDRILTFLSPERDLSGAGYQVYLSKLALSSGAFWGKGYKAGAVNALSYLPEKETDFIFSVIGEEFGLFGSTLVVFLYLSLILRAIFIARHSESIQGKLLSVSVCAMFLFHIIENICMTIGLLPVTGIPLPFISYGGSSMLSMSIGAGLLLSVRRKNYMLHCI